MKKKTIWLLASVWALTATMFVGSQANAAVLGFGTDWARFRMYSMPSSGGGNLFNSGDLGTKGGFGIASDASLPANTITKVIVFYDFKVNTGVTSQTVSFRLCRFNYLIMQKPICGSSSIPKFYSAGAQGHDSQDVGGFTALAADDNNGNVFIDDEYYVEPTYEVRSITVYVTGIFTGVKM